MPTRSWGGEEGPTFEIEWAGRPWALRLDTDRPGLVPIDLEVAPRLCLTGLASEAGMATGIFTRDALDQIERKGNRIVATYRPRDWNRLRVSASWEPVGDQSIDLEITAWTRDVELTKGIEVLIGDGWSATGNARTIEHRDDRAARSSRDGREAGHESIVDGPTFGGTELTPLPVESNGQVYAELVSWKDVARRIGRGSPRIGLALFGHDLERGVTLRARIRGLIIAPGEGLDGRLDEESRRFLDEPPSLGR